MTTPSKSKPVYLVYIYAYTDFKIFGLWPSLEEAMLEGAKHMDKTFGGDDGAIEEMFIGAGEGRIVKVWKDQYDASRRPASPWYRPAMWLDPEENNI